MYLIHYMIISDHMKYLVYSDGVILLRFHYFTQWVKYFHYNRPVTESREIVKSFVLHVALKSPAHIHILYVNDATIRGRCNRKEMSIRHDLYMPAQSCQEA